MMKNKFHNKSIFSFIINRRFSIQKRIGKDSIDFENKIDIEKTAEMAFQKAFQATLQANRSAVVVRDNNIVRISPNGTIEKISACKPKIHRPKGLIIIP